mmetsp:Transcript_17286/g.19272  ORF Transcript_17286/g.19272 Transcript_17286/m.19272 type:complete len:219 (+) Transcript_17286:24-680(+)
MESESKSRYTHLSDNTQGISLDTAIKWYYKMEKRQSMANMCFTVLLSLLGLIAFFTIEVYKALLWPFFIFGAVIGVHGLYKYWQVDKIRKKALDKLYGDIDGFMKSELKKLKLTLKVCWILVGIAAFCTAAGVLMAVLLVVNPNNQAWRNVHAVGIGVALDGIYVVITYVMREQRTNRYATYLVTQTHSNIFEYPEDRSNGVDDNELHSLSSVSVVSI